VDGHPSVDHTGSERAEPLRPSAKPVD
jgi:hypothetical protein